MPQQDNTQRPNTEPQRTDVEQRREPTNLSYRYGTIGIECVAAAVRYAGSGKNPAYAPVTQRVDQRFLESAM